MLAASRLTINRRRSVPLWSIDRQSIAIAGTIREQILREFGTILALLAHRRMDETMAQIVKPVTYSQTWTFFEGDWHEGNVPIMGPRTHAAWLASTVFDGARAFEGVAPDLDRHCARVNQSAFNFKLKPVVDTATWLELAREGIARFDANAELYIRPMYWAQTGSGGGVLFDP